MSAAHRITQRDTVIGIVGLGYVGLPLAIAFAKVGYRVIGIDTNPINVEYINRGESYVSDVSSQLIAQYAGRRHPVPANGNGATNNRFTGALEATGDYAAVARCDAIFICVPTPFDRHKTPDLSYVEAASEGIAEHLVPGQIIILQSTTYPGTTDEIVKPILERTGLRAGVDFHLAYAPERIDPGNTQWTIENTPKVVGGLTPACTRIAVDLLAQIYPNIHTVSSLRAAEMTKLLENIFRNVNIALVNELALLSERMDLDIWEIIDAAATKPFGFMPFYPGPGVGGHCIPVDPYYLSWKAREYDFLTHFIELAAETNQRMPYHTVELISRALGERGKGLAKAKVLLLGAAFKPGVGDARNAPALRVMELLLERGARVNYYDPYIPRVEIHPNAFYNGRRTLETVALTDDLLAEQDCVAILVRHPGVDYERVAERAAFVVDTVNALAGWHDGSQAVVSLGIGRTTHATEHS